MPEVSRRALLASTAAIAATVSIPGVLLTSANGAAAEAAVTAAQAPALKAFAVLDTEDWLGDIYFAASEEQALRLAGVDDGEEEGYECRHEGWADEFALSGEVPAKVAVVNGWRFECFGCGRTVSEDMDDWYDDDERASAADAPPINGIIGSTSRCVYCSTACKERHDAIKAKKKVAGAQMIDAMRQRIRALFGEVEFEDDASRCRPHVFVNYRDDVCVVEQAILYFRFPGQKFDSARYSLDRPQQHRVGSRWVDPIGPNLPGLSVCYGDVAAFNAWAGKELFKSADARLEAADA